MNELAEKLIKADAIAPATPVCFCTVSGQMKVFIDRFVPHYTKIRADIYLICTAWDSDTEMLKLTIESMRGCTRDCLENCTEKGQSLSAAYRKRAKSPIDPSLRKPIKWKKLLIITQK